MRVVALFLFIFLSLSTQAFVRMRSLSGEMIHWNSGVTSLNLYLDLTNRHSNISDADMFNILQASANEWAGVSKISSLQVISDQNIATTKNRVLFKNNLGSGVVGLTQLAYKSSTGEVLSGEITINTNSNLTADSNDANYIGGVFTHEIGHLLGLGHSETHYSTMIYTQFKGQHTLHSDDKLGLYNIYPKSLPSTGSLSGIVKGGTSSNPVSIFGAYVEVISSQTGRVIAGALSGANGVFTISGIPSDQNYYLYISPLDNLGSSVSKYYQSIRNDFCENGTGGRKSFVPSFYEECQTSGRPTKLPVYSGQTTSVGVVTVKCAPDVEQALYSDLELTLDSNDAVSPTGKVGGAFVSSIDEDGDAQVLFIDLSTLTEVTNRYLEVHLSSQSFYSSAVADLAVSRIVGTPLNIATDFASMLPLDSDNLPNINPIIRIPLSSTLSENQFKIEVLPMNVNDLEGFPGWSLLSPSYSLFLNSLPLYLLEYKIVESTDGTTFSEVATQGATTINGNLSCIDAPKAFTVSPSIEVSTGKDRSEDQSKSLMGCGTISSSGQGGSGGFFPSLLLGCFLIYFLRRKRSVELL